MQTAIEKGSDTVTTTYIDGLFEQVYDSATGNLTYRHYILAGGARVGVETIQANSGGTITADTLGFFVRDEVGSVIATVTESLGGANQQMSLTSYDAWGKARATSGSTAYKDLAPGSFYSPTPAGQEEGFAGHDNLSDTGLVDMEGRVYDPEVGRFLSADPNVQYPFSSQGYDRYTYVYDNPLSLSDPSGYFSEGVIGEVISDVGPLLNVIPVCEYWCTAAAEAVGGYMQSGNVGAGLEAGVLSFGESYAFTYVGDEMSWGSGATGLFEKSFTEGLIGGAFSEAGGGNFGDGFTGAFVSSELSPVIGSIGGNPNTNPAVYYSAANTAARVVVSAVVGGTVATLTGGNFSDAAFAAAMQRMFNDEMSKRISCPVSCQNIIKGEEAESLSVYQDQAGIFTIGYGHVLTPSDNLQFQLDLQTDEFEITQTEADTLFNSDLTFAVNAVRSDVHVQLNQQQATGLIDFTFNEGAGALAGSTALRLLNQDNYLGAASALLMWNKYTSGGQLNYSQGLMNRRVLDTQLLLEGTWQ